MSAATKPEQKAKINCNIDSDHCGEGSMLRACTEATQKTVSMYVLFFTYFAPVLQ